jgi:cob(I)alamin adenosyltransferase
MNYPTRRLRRRQGARRATREIVRIVTSEHVYNVTNIGLNIHSDLLCDISRKKEKAGQ